MPWTVGKDESACPASKPWAVKDKNGKKVGCHSSEAKAKKHQSALYANDTKAAVSAAVDVARGLVLATTAVDEMTEEVVEVSLVKIEDVVLVEVGMDLPASTGPITFTAKKIDAMVEAYSHPSLPRPRVKLGHQDPRYNNPVPYDGTPNFGFVESLRKDGIQLIGDITVPEWMGEILPIAFPSRSIEGWHDVELTGRKYAFCMTALALLGVYWPGVLSLEDLPLLAKAYGKEKPDFIEIDPSLLEAA